MSAGGGSLAQKRAFHRDWQLKARLKALQDEIDELKGHGEGDGADPDPDWPNED